MSHDDHHEEESHGDGGPVGGNPLLRSAGALLVRPGLHYQAPGGAGLRAFSPSLGGRWALAVNGEVSRSLLHRQGGIVRDVALEGCGIGRQRLSREQLLVAGSTLGLPRRPVWGNSVDGAARRADDVKA